MRPTSYADVFGLCAPRGFEEPLYVGAVVGSGQNLFPHYEVIALSGDKAWVRDLQTAADHIASARGFRILQRTHGHASCAPGAGRLPR